MTDDNKNAQEFSTQSDYYIKFLIYHLAIVVTIVFSLFSAVKKMEQTDIESKIDSVKNLRATTHIIPLNAINDNIIKGIYFADEACEDAGNVMAADKQMSSAAVQLAIHADSSEKRTLADTVSVSEQEIHTALNKQRQLLKEIEKASADAFQLRLTFLGDAQVDLRLWVFVLPFIFFLSCIYIFILDYKLALIKRQSVVAIEKQYPFNFLRSLFLAGEVFLVAFYIYIVFLFFTVQDSAIKNYVFYSLGFFIYYGFVYCLYFTQVVRQSGKDDDKQFSLYATLSRIWGKVKNVLSKINPFAYLGIGQLMMLATLLLVMTEGCNDNKGIEPKKGYQLVVDRELFWELFAENYVDDKNRCKEDNENRQTPFTRNDAMETALLVPGIFVDKFLYIALIIIAIISLSWYRPGTRRWMFKPAATIIIGSVFVFTIFFGLYYVFRSPSLSFPISLICVGYWYFSFYKRTDDPGFFRVKHLTGVIIFLLPLSVLAVVNTLKMFSSRNGWIFFFIALWLFLLAITFLEHDKKAALET